jgi:hypothetical protein
MSYKNVYQYLSNYDVDELIFPRLPETNHFNIAKIKEKNCVETHEKLTKRLKRPQSTMIDDFIETLVEKYGQNVSHFRFENFLVLEKYDIMLKKLKNNELEKVTINSTIETLLKYDSLDTSLSFTFRNKTDYEYLDSLKKLVIFTKCIKNELISSNSGLLKSIWLRLLASPVYVQPGKSIYNTDLIESLNQHATLRTKNGSTHVLVPHHVGYVSHFRSRDFSTKANIGSIQNLKLDVDYLFFLVRFSKSTKSKSQNQNV